MLSDIFIFALMNIHIVSIFGYLYQYWYKYLCWDILEHMCTFFFKVYT
jgi:hypothetical protein